MYSENNCHTYNICTIYIYFFSFVLRDKEQVGMYMRACCVWRVGRICSLADGQMPKLSYLSI